MSKYKLFFYAALGAASVMMCVPAVAQFEVAPDHFPDSPQAVSATAPGAELTAKIAAVAAELKGYEAPIRRQADAVENARELAAGAGGMGDSAYVFVDDYLQKHRDLEQLRHDLAPRIAQAQAGLDALNQMAAKDAVPVIAVSAPPQRKAIATAIAKAKPTASKRKPQSPVLSASARASH